MPRRAAGNERAGDHRGDQRGDKPGERPRECCVAVLGTGQMGLVCAAVLASAEPSRVDGPGLSRPARVSLWGHSADEVGELAQTRRSSRLENFTLPGEVKVCLKAASALKDADVIVSAVPVQFSRGVWEKIAAHVPTTAGIVSVSKGVEVGTGMLPTRVIQDVLSRAGKDDPDRRPRHYGVLSGPTIAPELARCLPATMIAASEDQDFARDIQRLFSTSWLRVYTHTDVLGVELAGAVKNVIAIAAGVIDGLGAGYNAKSALLARGLAEIARLGVAMGAAPETFFGVAGVGDLATTCFSPQGRNRSCGEALGKGQPLEEYLKSQAYVVEGVQTTRAVLELARKYRVDMPIIEAAHAVLFEGVDAIVAIGKLMSREPKAERVG